MVQTPTLTDLTSCLGQFAGRHVGGPLTRNVDATRIVLGDRNRRPEVSKGNENQAACGSPLALG
jgi:hypothetical protein